MSATTLITEKRWTKEEKKWQRRFINCDLSLMDLVINIYTNLRKNQHFLYLCNIHRFLVPLLPHLVSTSSASFPLHPGGACRAHAAKARFVYTLDEAECRGCACVLCLRTTERVLSSDSLRRIISTTSEGQLTSPASFASVPGVEG